MNNLLHAHLHRLGRNGFFRGLAACCTVLEVLVLALLAAAGLAAFRKQDIK